MSEIPYFFETPIPKYFREMGWFDFPKTVLFVTWAFYKCSPVARRVLHDGKELNLAPYEFITGRGKTSADCLLTAGSLRNQLKVMQNAGLLQKTTNSVTNRFTCYRWVTERFSKDNNQLNNKQTTNSQPTEQPQSRKKKDRYKEDHPPTPCLPNPSSSGDDGVGDSLSSKKKKAVKIEIYKDIFLTPSELEECIAARGSRDMVEQIVHQIVHWPARKAEIINWVASICKWKMKSQIPDRVAENEAFGKRLEDNYSSHHACTVRVYHDRNKDTRGVLFQGQGAEAQPIFILFSDHDFKEKCNNVLRDKRLQKGRIPKT